MDSMSAFEQALLEFAIEASEGFHILSDFDVEHGEDAREDGCQVQCEICDGLAFINVDDVVFSSFHEECLS